MRNLKRVLSLALSFVMVMSMMIVGAGAVNLSDFSDHEKIANDEAVTVLTTLGVINGKDDGTYDPEGIVTRAEMAKMICVILNGGKDPQLGQTLQNTYTDTVGHWAAPYIEYCTTLGIVSGRGNGTFDPNGTVTVAEAGKMVLVALGYNASVEGYTGGNWQINTDVRANALGLYDELGTLNTSVDLTRDNAAQMLYNALDVRMVEYSYVITGSADNSISTKPQLNDRDKNTLLYEKFGAVKVIGVVVGNEFANFGSSRPDTDRAPAGVNVGNAQDAGKTVIKVTNHSSNLTFSKNEEQGVYANGNTTFTVTTGENELGKAVWMYVKPASTSQKATVIGSAIISDDNQIITDFSGDDAEDVADDNNLELTSATQYIYNYGTQTSSAPAKDGWAGIHKTLIDTDGDNKVDYVLYREMRLGKVTLKTESGDGQIVVAVTGTGDTKGNYINKDKDDILGFDNVAKDDFVLTAYFGGRLHVQKAETVTGKIEAYKQTEIKNDAGTVTGYRNTGFTVDGENYTVSRVDTYTGTDLNAAVEGVDKTILSSDATFYLDENGYVVAFGDVDETAYKYAYVWGADAGKNKNINTDKVKVTLEDGTTRTYDLSTNSDIDVVSGTETSTPATSSSKAKIHEDDMQGMVFSYTLTSGGEIKLYLSKNGTVKVNSVGNDGAGAPTFNKGLTNIKVKNNAGSVSYMKPAALKASDVNENTTYYSNNATAFFYVTYDIGNGEVTKVNVYTGRNNAPSVDGSDSGNKNASTVLALNSKGDVGAAVFTNVKASESAGEHMFVISASYVSEDFCLVDAFLNGSTELSKDLKAALKDDAEVSHNPTISDGLYLYTLNSDGYYELTRPDPDEEPYYFEGTVARVNKASNTFVITETGTISGAFKQEFRLSKESIVVDNTLDTEVAVAGGSVSVGDKLQVIVNNKDDSEVLMAAIIGREDITNDTTGPNLTWDGETQPSGTKEVWLTGTKDSEKIAEALANGNDVYVDDDFVVDDGLNIPKGRTLYVTGDVVDDGTYSFRINGTLKVGGDLVTNYATVNSIEVHGDWTFTSTTGTNVTGTATVGGAVMSKGVDLTIDEDAALYADTMDIGTGKLTVNGHAEVSGKTVQTGIVKVMSNNTLIIKGELKCTDLIIGDAKNPGKAELGTLIATGDVVVENGTTSIKGKTEVTGDITIKEDGSVTITGEVKADNVTVENGSLAADKVVATGKIEITGKNPTVDVPVVDGKVDDKSEGGSVDIGTDKGSVVTLAENSKITTSTIYEGDVIIEKNVTIGKNVILTFNAKVTGAENLKGEIGEDKEKGSQVRFDSDATIVDTTPSLTTKFLPDESKGTFDSYSLDNLKGSTLEYKVDSDGKNAAFRAITGSAVYTVTAPVTASADSKSIYA